MEKRTVDDGTAETKDVSKYFLNVLFTVKILSCNLHLRDYI